MIDQLITALENLQEAKAEYKEAVKKYEYERDYFLQKHEKAIDKAKEEFAKIFKSAVSDIAIEILNGGLR